MGDGNVGVDEAVGQLALTHATVHWLFPLLLNHLHRVLCAVTHAHITARDATKWELRESRMKGEEGWKLGERVGEPCEGALIQRYSPQPVLHSKMLQSFPGLVVNHFDVILLHIR